MAYEPEEVYEYDDPVEFEIEQLKNEAAWFQQNVIPRVRANSTDVSCLLEQKDEALALSAKIGRSLLQQVNQMKCRYRELRSQLDAAVEQTYQLQHEKQQLQQQLQQSLIDSQDVVTDSPVHSAASRRRSSDSITSEAMVSVLREKVSELKLDNDRLSREVTQLTGELDSVSTVASGEVRASRRREELKDRELRQLREKLDLKQRIVCQRDEQINSRNVELVFLAGQLVKMETEMEKMQSRLESSLTHSVMLQDRYDEAAKQCEEYAALYNILRAEQSGRRQHGQIRRQQPHISMSAGLEIGFNSVTSSALDEHRRMSDVMRLINASSVDIVSSATSSSVDCRVVCGCRRRRVSDTEPTPTVALTGDYWQQKLRMLGQPGRPGSRDLDIALGRQTIICSLPVTPCHGPAAAAAAAVSHSVCETVSSHITNSSCPHCSAAANSSLPPKPKLQLVKVFEGSVLLQTWRQLTTPNLASVLDVRRGVWVRGGVELSGDSLQHTVTCEHSSTVVTQSGVTCVCSSLDQNVALSCQSNHPQSSNICSTIFDCRGILTCSSGILSRGFMPEVDRKVGLAAVLDPSPRYVASCREHRPNDVHSRLSARGDLETNDHRCEMFQRGVPRTLSGCFETGVRSSSGLASVLGPNHVSSGDLRSTEVRREFCPYHGTSLLHGLASSAADQQTGPSPVLDGNPCSKNSYSDPRPSSDLQVKRGCNLCHDTSGTCPHYDESNDLSTDLQRPSSDLEADGDLDLLGNKPGTSSFRYQSSPLCCSYCRPLTEPRNILSTAATVAATSATYSNLYDELLPYLSNSETEDPCTSGVATDDEY